MQIGGYVVKWGQELAWAAFVAAVGVLYTYVTGLTLGDVLGDPLAVLAGLGLALSRVIGALVVNALGKLLNGAGTG